MRAFRKRSVWVMITVYVALWLAATLVGGVILNGFRKTINTTLGLSGYRTETLSNENEDLEYFKSQFVQKNEDGSVKYVIDEETGYKHLVYDDKALYEAGLQKARQVQREGTTILWNSASNGLPF